MTGMLDMAALPDGSVDEVLRQGEACLADTLALALAADQRGATMAGILGAGAIALLAAAAAVPDAAGLTLPFLASAAFLFIATLMVAWSARPTMFHIGGYEPRILCEGDLADPIWLKRFVIADVQARIDKNRSALDAASHWFSGGLIAAALAPLAGIAAFVGPIGAA